MYDYGLLAACYPSLFAKNVRVSKHTLLPRRSVRAWIRGRKLYTPAQGHLRAPAVLAARFCALRSWGSAFLCFSLLARQQVREKTAGWKYLNLDTTLSRYNVIYPSPRARPLSGSLTVRCAWLQRASPRSSVALAWAMLVEPARRTVCGTPPPAARCCASRYSKPKRSRRR